MSAPPGPEAQAAPPEGDSPEGEACEPPGLLPRLLRLLVAPRELFRALEERPVWLDVLVLVTAMSVATTLLIPEELVRQTMMQQAPEGADAGAVEEMAGFVRTAGIVAAVVGPLFAAAAIAGATYLVFSLLLGGRSTYEKLFSAAAHVMVIPSAGALLTVPLILATGDVQTSLALHLLTPDLGADSYLFRFLRGLNVFGLAGAGVMGVAVGTMYRERSSAGAATVLLGLYVALKAAMALAGGG